MEEHNSEPRKGAKRASTLHSFQIKSFPARKSAPVIPPPPYSFINDDDDDNYEDKLPKITLAESNGTGDPPSQQLLQESRTGQTIPNNALVSESARSSQLGSPPKSVHFSGDAVAEESVILLQRSRSSRNTSLQPSPTTRQSLGKLKRPSIRVSSQYNSNLDDSVQLAGELEADRPRSRKRRTNDIGSSPRDTLEGDDKRKRPTLSNNDEMAESKQSQVGPVQERLKYGHSIQSSKSSSGNKWSKEDSLTLAILRDANISYEDLQRYFPTRSVKAIAARAASNRKNKRLRITNADKRRVLNEYNSWKNSQQITVPTQSHQRSAEQEGSNPSKNTRSSNRLSASDKSETPSKPNTADLSSRTTRRMEREKRRREAYPEDQHTIYDDVDEAEEIPKVIRGHNIDQMQINPRREPEVQINSNIIVRPRLDESPAEVSISRKAKHLPKPPSSARSTSHHDQLTQRVKAPRVYKRNRRETNEPNEELEIQLGEDELEEEVEGQHEGTDVEMEVSSKIRSDERDRLWGYQATLESIFSYVEEYCKARQHFYENQHELEAIEQIRHLCDDTASKYNHAQATSSINGLSEADARQVEQFLQDISKLVEELDPDDEGEDDDDHAVAAMQIYLYVFPALIKLLQAAVEYHCGIIATDDPHAMLNIPGLNSLNKIFVIIETLDGRSKTWKAKPKVSRELPVIRDMRNNVTTKIKHIGQNLCNRAAILRNSAAEKKLKAKAKAIANAEAKADRRRIELEQQQEAERIVMKEKMIRLGNLYFERLKLEPDIYRQSQLRTPKFDHRVPELDANGEPFERVSMFQERNSNHIPHEWEDGEQEWQDDEILAIIDGLKTYYGSKKFWIRIFRKNCGNNGPLRDRKVHEILRQTKFMRDIWIQADQEEGRVTEDYILNIPDLDLLELL